jgi:dTDP-4-amino-4,6-dideoxygalactose transaminase
MSTRIPLLDLNAQHASIGEELDAAIARVLEHKRFIGGPEVEVFEREFAEYCSTGFCVGVSNGTTALELALEAAGVGPGDQVVTCGFTFIATVEAIVRRGATPVLVDVEYDTALMTPELTEPAIGAATKAIIVVHLYGQPVDLAGFRSLCDARGLCLIEDSAQAHGAASGSDRAGSVGEMATFSFFPGKNLGALGDAGAITTGDAELAKRLDLLRNHGRAEHYRHTLVGTNARLDTIQAAALSVKLRHLDPWNEARRANAAHYDEAFRGLEGVNPIVEAPGRHHVYHQYVLRVPDRESAAAKLADQGVATAVHYPLALNHQPAFEATLGAVELPTSERLAREVLSIPVHPDMDASQLDRVVAAVNGLSHTKVAS